MSRKRKKERLKMNVYEEKQEAKKNYYEKKAAQARAKSNAECNIASNMGKNIPMGQPILIGHHSENRDRRYREQMGKHMDNSIKEMKKAEYYDCKAESVGMGGISSDDPDAIEKLQAKLDKLQKSQERMKAANKAIRIKDIEKGNAKLIRQGFTQEQIEKVRTPDFCGRIGFPSYALQNNNAKIDRLKKRIESLKKAADREPVTVEKEGYTYKEEDNRCQFVFDGKPESDIRDILKGWSFRWSPSHGAWVRQLTENGRYAAIQVMDKLDETF